jgi:hypothetical protein
LANIIAALPFIDNLSIICSIHAMLAFPLGGIPYFHLGSCNNFSCPQSLILNGGFARIKSAFNPLCKSF